MRLGTWDTADQKLYWPDVLQFRDWSNIKILSLCNFMHVPVNCGITDENIKYLLQLEWPNLDSLNIGNIQKYFVGWNPISAKGVKELTKKEWPKL